MSLRLLFLPVLLLSFHSFSQSIGAIEKMTSDCLNEKLSAAEWTWLERIFETYLVDNKFGSLDSINSAYYNFSSYQGFFGSRKYPQLKDRVAVKAQMTQLGMIDGSVTVAAPLVACFADLHPNFKSYPDTAVTRFIVLADLCKQETEFGATFVNAMLTFLALGNGIEPQDYSNVLVRRAVILIGLPIVIYYNELDDGSAKADNPLFREEEERAKKRANNEYEAVPPQWVDREPEPEGGYDAYKKWIHDNNKHRNVRNKSARHKVTVVFAVDTFGKVVDLKVDSTLDQKHDDEALRLIREHPVQKWIPGTEILAGKTVKVKVRMDVEFLKE